MKRALLFIFVFLGALVVVFGITFIPNLAALKTLLNNNESLFEGSQYVDKTNSLKDLTVFIGNHPEYVSIVSVNLDFPDSAISYNADVPRTMGTLGNIFLLAEYERQVENGLLNPVEKISIKDLEYIALPKVNNRDHKRAISDLKKINSKEVALEQVVKEMVAKNDIALADFLWFKLGGTNIQAVIDSLGLKNTELPLPYAGLYIAINPNLSDTARVYSYEEIVGLAESYVNNADFNKKVKKSIKKNRLGLSFMQERDALQRFPKTTAADLNRIMLLLQEEEFISEKVSKNIKEKMEWIYEERNLSPMLAEYGALYDNRMGMVAGIDFGTSKYSGNHWAQTVIFDNLPVAFWLHLYSNQMQGDFQQRIIWDPLLHQTTLNEIYKSE